MRVGPALTFGFAGKLDPIYSDVQRQAWLNKNDLPGQPPIPVGVAMYAVPSSQPGLPAPAPLFQAVSQDQYRQAAQAGRLVWTAP